MIYTEILRLCEDPDEWGLQGSRCLFCRLSSLFDTCGGSVRAGLGQSSVSADAGDLHPFSSSCYSSAASGAASTCNRKQARWWVASCDLQLRFWDAKCPNYHYLVSLVLRGP